MPPSRADDECVRGKRAASFLEDDQGIHVEIRDAVAEGRPTDVHGLHLGHGLSVLTVQDMERGPCSPRSNFAAGQCYIELLTALFSLLPAENLGTFDAGMCTRSLGLRGFTPWRAARFCTENLPKPVKATSSPFRSASVIESRNASTASPA